MLGIGRKEGQSIFVRHGGETLRIVVIKSGTAVRLGFDGPRSFEVQRDDVRTWPEHNAAFLRPDDGEDCR